MVNIPNISKENISLQAKYRISSIFYDMLDYPWERQYKKWRPGLLNDVYGAVIEAGVGTGRNLRYYPSDAKVTGIDLSEDMLKNQPKEVALPSVRFIQFMRMQHQWSQSRLIISIGWFRLICVV